jgi:hypothetical protein
MNRPSTLALLLLFPLAFAMEMDDGDYTRPNITNAGSKTFHWLLAVFLGLILPSISTVLVFAEKLHAAVLFQIICAAYFLFDVLFLSFPDGDGVENRTSKGTGVTLMLASAITVFFALLHSGSKFLQNGKMGAVAKLSERSVRIIHRTLSVIITLIGWVRACMAPVAMFGFCRDLHTGQCLAHGIMGSAFVGYGFVYVMVLVLPYFRESSHKHSQEFYDSTVMMIWGIVNTFTEHRWGTEPWGHGDYQHTAMGIIWWCGGLLGMFLSRGGRRSFIPSLLLIYTGWAMSEHVQELAVSTKVHYMFGLVLMTGGALRIMEIAFLLRDERCVPGKILSFQYLPSFCLIESGVLFMGANEEQLELVLRLKADHSSYIMVITGAAFMIYLWMLLLLELYQKLSVTSKIDLASYSAVERSTGDAQDFELDDLEE